MDLRDLGPEVEKIGFGLIKVHPTYEKIESGDFEPEDVRGLLADVSSAMVLPPGS